MKFYFDTGRIVNISTIGKKEVLFRNQLNYFCDCLKMTDFIGQISIETSPINLITYLSNCSKGSSAAEIWAATS